MGRYIPGHFRSPFGLALRLLRSGDPDALGAMGQAAAGLVLAPLDLLLSHREARLYAAAEPPRLPQLFVCGPPRSGTSLVAQVLIGNLPVAYLSNLCGLFPRSPLLAERVFGARLPGWRPRYRSYYGRVAALRGPNDALQLWDRWLGPERTRARSSLTAAEGEALRRFFGAWERWSGRPLVAKNNNLNLQARAVAPELPTARFLCLERDPRSLTQSLLAARRFLHGDEATAYGLAPPGVAGEDPFDSVCRQVRYLMEGARAEQAAVGAERFWIVGYEAFCARPAEWIERVGRELLRLPADALPAPPAGLRFEARTRPALPPDELAALDAALRRAGLAG